MLRCTLEHVVSTAVSIHCPSSGSLGDLAVAQASRLTMSMTVGAAIHYSEHRSLLVKKRLCHSSISAITVFGAHLQI